jgi:hypothetical protein
MVVLAAILAAPSTGSAFFPPNIGLNQPPVPVVPPDPFGVPDTGGLGEPESPDPGPGPSVQTPEPASIVTALTGLILAGGYGLRKRRQARAAE